MGLVGCGLGGMEEIKKSASPKKKPLRGKKVGFAEKKSPAAFLNHEFIKEVSHA